MIQKYSKMNLVATVYGDDQPEKSTTEMGSIVGKFSNLKGVIAPTTGNVQQQRKLYKAG